ncbi:MAG: nucleotide exchange factor GrpE [Cyanobacteria bacterium TGS_CYA1]|nr:nucleotide exchange factor GrpE [Cyanobacteria bacterium TGS_CYA1]
MSDQDNQNPSQEEEKPQAPSRSESRGGDRNAAKAFYRAMYAGAEPDPEDFGMKVDKEEEYAARERAATEALAKRMEGEMAELEKKASDAESLNKRLAADFDNYRKRMAREREEFQALGIQKAIETMLPALDDMDLAKANLSKTSDPKAMLDSLNMVYNRFTKCLEMIGIKQLDVIGTPFDPKFHEPVQQIVTAEVPDGAVVHQLRPGYVFNDKVLRPSLVNVATAPPEGYEDPGASSAPAAEEEVPHTSTQDIEPYAAEDQEQALEVHDITDSVDSVDAVAAEDAAGDATGDSAEAVESTAERAE